MIKKKEISNSTYPFSLNDDRLNERKGESSFIRFVGCVFSSLSMMSKILYPKKILSSE